MEPNVARPAACASTILEPERTAFLQLVVSPRRRRARLGSIFPGGLPRDPFAPALALGRDHRARFPLIQPFVGASGGPAPPGRSQLAQHRALPRRASRGGE